METNTENTFLTETVAVAPPADVLDLFTTALPAVKIEWQPLPDDRAWVLTGEPGGEMVLVHNYHGEHDPRPMLCNKHGVQRHDWNGRGFVCKMCGR